MNFKNLNVKNILTKLGENNNPVYAVGIVALFKGVLRPTFTLMDKKQDPKSKKYAAAREGTTEIVAVPTYVGMTLLSGWVAKKIFTPIEHRATNFKDLPKAIKTTVESAQTTFRFLGVCLAAVAVIPGLCNVVMPLIFKDKNKGANAPTVKPAVFQPEFNVPKSLSPVKSLNSVYSTSANSGGLKV